MSDMSDTSGAVQMGAEDAAAGYEHLAIRSRIVWNGASAEWRSAYDRGWHWKLHGAGRFVDGAGS